MSVLVWDASPLAHADQIDRLDVLGETAMSLGGRHVTTAAVLEELKAGGHGLPSWLDVVNTAKLALRDRLPASKCTAISGSSAKPFPVVTSPT